MSDYIIEVPSNWGGDREHAGRHPVEDKKKQLAIGIRQSVIAKLGGDKWVKRIMADAIDKALAEIDTKDKGPN